MTDSTRRGRLQLLAVAAIFIGPLIAAFLLYYGGIWKPAAQAVNGVLIDPPVPLTTLSGPSNEATRLFRDVWSLLVVAPGNCSPACRDALYETRQLRRALGKDSQRVQRVWLVDGGTPDLEFLRAEHPQLLIIDGRKEGAGLLAAIDTRAEVGIFLIDPHGNLIMRFPPELGMRGMHTDIKRLLKVSRIG